MKHRTVILQVLALGLTLSMLVFPAAMLRASQATVPAAGWTIFADGQTGTGAQSLATALPAGTFCPANLIAYLELEEPGVPSGPVYADLTENHPGICRGSAATCPSEALGRIGVGQEFDGTATGINIPPHPDFDWLRTDSWSIEFWVQTDASSTCQDTEVMVGRDSVTEPVHWWVGCDPGGTMTFLARSKFSEIHWVNGYTDITDGAWHHAVAVRDGSATQISLYVDGIEEGWKRTNPDFWGDFDDPDAEVNIGWLDAYLGYHFDGILDEVAIYDRALSRAEILQHYQNGLGGQGYCATPAIAVDKTANPVVRVGETATYSYLVTNPGDTALSSIQLTDDKCSPVSGPIGDANGNAKLDPGETWTYSCAQTLNVDTTNTATAIGTHSFGGTVSANDTFTVRVVSPQIAVDKTADPMVVYPGDTVTYDYQVTNPGDDPLSAISVTDDKCSSVTGPSGDSNGNAKLDPGETWRYTCTQALAVDTTNTVTASGTDSTGATVSAQDQVSVNVVSAAIAVDKTADKKVALSGAPVTYSYAVTNPGDDPLSNIQISDDKCSPVNGPSGDSNGNAKLDQGETWRYTCTQALTVDTTNTATATGTDSAGGTVQAQDTVTVDVILVYLPAIVKP